ncbi:hypothetical protein [Bradyrhizobium sp. USDA 4509]
MAHARRKFVEVFKTTQSPFAREVIEACRPSTRSKRRSAASVRSGGFPLAVPGVHR